MTDDEPTPEQERQFTRQHDLAHKIAEHLVKELAASVDAQQKAGVSVSFFAFLLAAEMVASATRRCVRDFGRAAGKDDDTLKLLIRTVQKAATKCGGELFTSTWAEVIQKNAVALDDDKFTFKEFTTEHES